MSVSIIRGEMQDVVCTLLGLGCDDGRVTWACRGFEGDGEVWRDEAGCKSRGELRSGGECSDSLYSSLYSSGSEFGMLALWFL